MRVKDVQSGQDSGAGRETAKDSALVPIDGDLVRSVEVRIEARLGEIQMSIDQLTGLKPGESITFDRRLNEPIDLYLNGTVIARGEIVAVDDHFGVRIVEIAAVT
jgi:flagellar motor switch protein FliN/FliY